MLLGLVLVFGVVVNGSRSWFQLGPVSFQPCELSKITTSLVLAHILRTPGFRLGKLRDFAAVLAVVGIPAALILAGGETGTLLVYVGYVFMLYREGLSGWWLVFLFAFVLLLALVLVFGSTVNGSKSWFHLGPVSFQPCELSKITTSLVLAHILRTPGFRLGKLRDFATVLAVVGIPAACWFSR